MSSEVAGNVLVRWVLPASLLGVAGATLWDHQTPWRGPLLFLVGMMALTVVLLLRARRRLSTKTCGVLLIMSALGSMGLTLAQRLDGALVSAAFSVGAGYGLLVTTSTDVVDAVLGAGIVIGVGLGVFMNSVARIGGALLALALVAALQVRRARRRHEP